MFRRIHAPILAAIDLIVHIQARIVHILARVVDILARVVHILARIVRNIQEVHDHDALLHN